MLIWPSLGLVLTSIVLGWFLLGSSFFLSFFSREKKQAVSKVTFESKARGEVQQKNEDELPPALCGAPKEVIEAYLGAALGTPLQANMRNVSSFFRGTSISGGQVSGVSAALIDRCRMVCSELDEEVYDPTEAPGRLIAKRGAGLTSTVEALLRMPRVTLLAGIDAVFENEEGRDAGGVVKEYLTEVASEVQPLSLFTSVADGTIHIHENASILHLLALGRLVGSIITYAARRLAFGGISSPTLELHLCTPLAKLIAGEKIAASDIASVDPDLYRTRLEIIRSDPHGIQTLKDGLSLEDEQDLVFAWYDPVSGEPTEALHPHGYDHIVTNDNLDTFLRETAEFFFLHKVRRETSAFLNGIHSVLGENATKIIQHRDLLLLLNGVSHFDLSDWRKHTITHVPATVDPQLANRVIDSFWSLIDSELTHDARSRLLLYSTGAATLPPPGTFKDLHPKFKIVLDPSLPLHNLPVAHTCFNQLHLPLLDDKKKLAASLQLALDHGLGHFGLA